MKKYLLIAVVTALALVSLGVFAGPALAAGPLIVIDPGHSGTSLTTIDPETQIQDEEYNNGQENQDVWDVSLLLKAKLEAAGYTVLLTKDGPYDTVCKRDRVNIANNNDAALAVSLHTSGHIFGQYGQIYVQRMDSYRENINGQRVYFNLPDVAVLSQKYGQTFLTERRKIEGSSVVITVNSSFGGRDLAPGNLPIVQLFSKVPWVYVEAGVPQNSNDKERYAQSVFNSIAACVPLDYVSPPVDSAPFRIRYDQTDTNLYYTGTWPTYTVSGSSGPSYKRTDSGSSSVTVRFKGTYFAWIATCGTILGRAFVSLDGGPAETVDLYRTSTERQQNVWSVTFDTAETHAVKIWRDPSNASGTYISVDAVEVVGPVNSLLPGSATTPLPPTIASLNPKAGSTTGGTSVVITGTNFTGATAVTFDGNNATSYTVNSATQITAAAPAHAEGTVRVQVTAPGGSTGDTSTDDYNYIVIPPPMITALNTATGTTTGGTGVIITGANLSEASVVTFGGTAAAFTVNSATQITAIAPAHAAGPVSVRVTTTSGSTPDTTADDFRYVAAPTTTRYEQTSTAFLYTGTWTLSSVTSASGGSFRYINTSGGSVTIPFNGTYLALICKKSTSYGVAKITVDGLTTYAVDLYDGTNGSTGIYQQNVWNTGTLPSGYHTVKLEWTGTKRAAATATNVNIDAVNVAGTLVSTTHVEQTSTLMLYAGSWTLSRVTSASGGSFRYANTPGSSVTINFTGLRLNLIAKEAANYGIAKITLDGTTTFNVDLYSASTLYKQIAWSSGFLAPANHTVKIEWTGDKRTAATATNINIDAVDVLGLQ
jgi:N-acetylmuramoyl-L-alanine amidase